MRGRRNGARENQASIESSVFCGHASAVGWCARSATESVAGKTGPRCRISVVTTTAPFVPDAPAKDPNTLLFCGQCKKCVQGCPAQAIPDGHYSEDPDSAGWKVHADKCFTYWCKAGTDCARCMAVCPYSHDNSLLHRKGRTASRLHNGPVTTHNAFCPGRKGDRL